MQPHILLINIRADLVRSLDTQLSAQGYRVSQLEDIPAPAVVQQLRPDLLVMVLPEDNNPNLAPCRRLSLSLNQIPIMLLGKDNHSDRIASLNVCANDYLPMPFAMEEFMARVRAKLRRISWKKTDELFILANLHVDARVREVRYGEHAIDLTAKEFDLLRYLIAHPRQVMTVQQILDEIWPDSVLSDSRNIVQVYVGSLRRKLGNAADLLQTVRGVGYVLKDPATVQG
ncbi:transcriptional regulator [Leptolyngbya sp. Heron Island J]|uniref:response regulator transcription factor n=1 Tax=Leptolyngbya sp. Heron Island J TaxID=1385935 RepID=UPI0003B975B6|nr:response regulator transcription factor [Leptolyngbya sp. Heron Island J]ESA38641.1 transcriptional regulator [Leptolyngbya sp. Heron Island J]